MVKHFIIVHITLVPSTAMRTGVIKPFDSKLLLRLAGLPKRTFRLSYVNIVIVT